MTAKEIQAQIEKLQEQLVQSATADLPKPELQDGEVFADLTLEQLTVLRTSYLKTGTKIVRVILTPGGPSNLRFENFGSDGEVTKSGDIAKNVPFPKRTSRR